jgi:sarcosine oxidase subunit alpha
LRRSDCLRSDRKQLVGLRTLKPEVVVPEGAQIVAVSKQSIPMEMHGHVSSSYYTATLGRSIALAVVKDGLRRTGEVVYCPLAGGNTIAAEIVPSVFYDPKALRQNV